MRAQLDERHGSPVEALHAFTEDAQAPFSSSPFATILTALGQCADHLVFEVALKLLGQCEHVWAFGHIRYHAVGYYLVLVLMPPQSAP